MERGQGGRGDFGFGDPFAGFGRGFGRTSSFFPSLFGGQDPFDNPFFSQPFGSMMGPSMFGPSMFGQMRTPFDELHHSNFIEQAPATNNSMPSMFGQMRTPFDELHHSNFIEQAPATNNSRGIVIRELDEEEHGEAARNGGGRSTGEPHVQEPDEEIEEESGEQVQFASRSNMANYGQQPQARTYSFQSSRVTYGGVNGAYYTSSTTRRSGSDGISMEENREADTTTGRATHRVSRGIHDKGHSVTRRLNSDGRVDTAQMLHNLEEDELPKFEENWRGNARQHLPEWNHDTNHGGYGGGGGPIRRDRHAGRVNALPPTEQSRGASGSGSSRTRFVPIS
ncbi:myeloid leukemia factor 1-like protein [Carex littledalei]|uniref:Myeloid leukemia factor 1-like protein n=1 Tax=Carex littledalei TaxID=544730 RepID=A0A833QTH9_9POAL|nr:myeloid leukemia factor 1-like protein [Carex littledalei]